MCVAKLRELEKLKCMYNAGRFRGLYMCVWIVQGLEDEEVVLFVYGVIYKGKYVGK